MTSPADDEWSVPHWVIVARSERARSRAVLVSGWQDEAGAARGIAEGAGEDVEVVDAPDPVALASLVSWAGRVATTDRDLACLADALGTPSVLILGDDRHDDPETADAPGRIVVRLQRDGDEGGVRATHSVVQAVRRLPRRTAPRSQPV